MTRLTRPSGFNAKLSTLSLKTPCLFVLAVLFAFSNLTFAQGPSSSPSNPSENKPLAELTSKSRNLFHKMNDRGLSFQAMMVYDWSKTLDDEQDSGSGFGRYSID